MDIGSEGVENTTKQTGPAHARSGRRSWWRIISATVMALVTDRGSIAAAGCAFYATLALFPAITTLVSVYGLVFDRESIEQQLLILQGLVPPQAYALIANRVHDLVTQPAARLGVRLVISALVTFWSASTGTKSLFSALNVAYNVNERRNWLRFQAVTLGMTLAAMVVGTLGIAVLVFVPVVIGFVGLEAESGQLIHAAGSGMLIIFVAGSIAALYRVGPSRVPRADQRLFPGVTAATGLWLVASACLNFYVANLTNLGATYGSIAAVVGIMLWFYLTAYAVLMGAELNAQLERDATE